MDFKTSSHAAIRIWQNGGVPFYFSTPVMCDGTAQSNQGMSYSLQSRNAVAQMVVNQLEAHSYHGALSSKAVISNHLVLSVLSYIWIEFASTVVKLHSSQHLRHHMYYKAARFQLTYLQSWKRLLNWLNKTKLRTLQTI